MSFSSSTPPPPLITALGIITLLLIATVLFFSFLSLAFIIQLSFFSRRSPRLLRFTSISAVRSFLVLLIIFWSLNEFLRLPRLSPFILSASAEATVCKLHTALSFGLLEPAFLLTLLFLVQVSIREKRPRGFLTFALILGSCAPILALQIFFLFFSHLDENQLPQGLFKSWAQISDSSNSSVICAYPLVGTAIFAVFLMIFLPSFTFACWRVVSIVINKGLRSRICLLAVTVSSTLAAEIVVLALLLHWNPDDAAYEGGCMVAFLCRLVRAAVANGILVIKPVAESLAAGGQSSSDLPVGGAGAASAPECSLILGNID